MRISDDDMFESISKLELLGTKSHRVNLALAVYLDLWDARAEIARLIKDNAELIKCIEDIKK